MVFSVKKGGLLCRGCRGKISDGKVLLPSSLYTLQYVISAPVEKLYNFIVKNEVLQELEGLMDAYLQEYLHKSFKSLEILETIAD